MMMGKFPRVLLWIVAVSLVGAVPLPGGAVASKTSSGTLTGSKGQASPPSFPNPFSSKAEEADESLPQKEESAPPTYVDGMRRQLSKEDADKRNPWMRKLDNNLGGQFYDQRSTLDGVSREDGMRKNSNFQRSFSMKNSDGLRFFNRKSKFDKASSYSDQSSSFSGKEYATQSFQFRNQPGLPEFDMPPSSYFASKETQLSEPSNNYAARKARGFDRVTTPKPYLGPEADRAQADMKKVSQAFMGQATEDETGEIDFSSLPDRPLNIQEVKSLLNDGRR